jgi:hypothetical protein
LTVKPRRAGRRSARGWRIVVGDEEAEDGWRCGVEERASQGIV